MTNDYRKLCRQWLDSPALSEAEWKELSAVSENEDELESRFYAPLEFGTAGLRGVMGIGLNRMNIHVVRHASQAFAETIAAEGPAACKSGVVVCYDCRENSELFARETACVMAANGIHVRLFDAMRPTPELSFAIRHYHATAGVNITASHNPREYNGYKVYWSDGAQLPPREADAVAQRMRSLDIFCGPRRIEPEEAVASGLLEYIGSETDEAFLAEVLAQNVDPECVRRAAPELPVVYTPFHGAGRLLVPEALRRLGLTRLHPVPEQMVPDGSFPTVKSPNPENPQSFYLAEKLAAEVGAGLIIGTDPDSDRVGVMVRRGEKFVPISGNQMGALFLYYFFRAHREKGTLPETPCVITTIVSSLMIDEIARQNGLRCDRTFTGFKFMAELLAEYEAQNSFRYLLAFEESYGYMAGDFVRDKDAVTASVLITEMAAHYQLRGMSLLDALDELYARFGFYGEETLNLVMPGVDGLERMRALMASLRQEPPAALGGTTVAQTRDYLSGDIRVAGLVVERTHIVGSNVLYFELEDGSVVIVRPSGTEPKLKIYLLVRGKSAAERDERLERYAQSARELADREV